jgi:Fe-S-cluster-containing dehydrogenase component
MNEITPLAASETPAAPQPPKDAVPLEAIAPAIAEASVTRRRFLGFGLALVGGLAGTAILTRFFPVFDELDREAPAVVPTWNPEAKAWTFVIDSGQCIGCGLCVEACKHENHVPAEGELTRTWVERHTTTTDDAHYVDSPEGGIDGFPAVAEAVVADRAEVASAWFEPRLCMQCEDSPCTKVCPVGATYTTADGVILVDARRCIGCGYCIEACPYGARYLVPAGPETPAGTPGIADKCTWCYHRISQGGRPACVEVCPVGARRFGDRNDPNDPINTVLRERQPEALHPEYGTKPRVLYLGPAVQEA